MFGLLLLFYLIFCRKLDVAKEVAKGLTTQFKTFKVSCIGPGTAGKTSTIRSLHNEPFKADIERTIGIKISQSESCQTRENVAFNEIVDFTKHSQFREVVEESTKELLSKFSSENEAIKEVKEQKAKFKVEPKVHHPTEPNTTLEKGKTKRNF